MKFGRKFSTLQRTDETPIERTNVIENPGGYDKTGNGSIFSSCVFHCVVTI